MRNLEEVTEEEMKTAFENTPALCNYFTWAQVQENPMLIISLKNQVIAKEEHKMETQTGTNSNVFLLPMTGRLPLVACAPVSAPAPEVKRPMRRSTITLHERQIEKIKNALVLSRNCLKYGGMSDAVRNEALESLAESQKIIQSFYEPRV